MNVLKIFVVLCALLAALESGAEEFPEPRARDHKRLLYFVDDAGAEQPVNSVAEWERRRGDILIGVQAAMGPLPSRKDLPRVKYETSTDAECGAFVRQKLAIHVGDKTPLAAWLLLPKRFPGKRPAIVALHQTTNHTKNEPAGIDGLPNLHYGLEMALRGYVVIIPDYPSLGQYAYDFNADEFASGSMKGIWNHLRCVDLLCERDDVDPERIGAIGHSLGGHNAMFLAVFDPRVKAIVTSCGWTPAHDYYGGKLAGWAGERYMPRIQEAYGLDPNKIPFDFYELVAAIAPRGFFSCSPTGDSNFDVAGVRKAIPLAAEVYRLYASDGAPKGPSRLEVRYPECGHDFPALVRREAYEFLDALLKP